MLKNVNFRLITREEKKSCEETIWKGKKWRNWYYTPAKFDKECLEVYDVTFSQIQWRFEKLTEVCDDLNCVTSEALAVKSVKELQKSAAKLSLRFNDDINGAGILSEVESLKFQWSAILRLLNIEIARCNLEV